MTPLPPRQKTTSAASRWRLAPDRIAGWRPAGPRHVGRGRPEGLHPFRARSGHRTDHPLGTDDGIHLPTPGEALRRFSGDSLRGGPRVTVGCSSFSAGHACSTERDRRRGDRARCHGRAVRGPEAGVGPSGAGAAAGDRTGSGASGSGASGSGASGSGSGSSGSGSSAPLRRRLPLRARTASHPQAPGLSRRARTRLRLASGPGSSFLRSHCRAHARTGDPRRHLLRSPRTHLPRRRPLRHGPLRLRTCVSVQAVPETVSATSAGPAVVTPATAEPAIAEPAIAEPAPSKPAAAPAGMTRRQVQRRGRGCYRGPPSRTRLSPSSVNVARTACSLCSWR